MVQFFLFGWVEGKRWMDYRKPGSQAEPGSFLGLEGAFKSQSNGYPGGILFDPLGFSRYFHLILLQTLWYVHKTCSQTALEKLCMYAPLTSMSAFMCF